MMKLQINNLYFLIPLFLMSSCTKEIDNWIDKKADTVIDTLKALPANRIIEYKVSNVSDEHIYSAVDDSLKTITVYLPAYYQLGVIQPEIKLPQGATISPSADEPVPVFGQTPFTYQVTSAKGLKATYTMNIVIQQPDFTLRELSTATKIYTVKASSNGSINLRGTNILGNYEVTSAYLFDTEGKEVGKLVPNGNTEPTSTSIVFMYGSSYNLDIPTGTYYIELRSYALKKRMNRPVILERYVK